MLSFLVTVIVFWNEKREGRIHGRLLAFWKEKRNGRRHRRLHWWMKDRGAIIFTITWVITIILFLAFGWLRKA